MQQSTALFFLSGFSQKKNEGDGQVLKLAGLWWVPSTTAI
jgi:hypothetical protein